MGASIERYDIVIAGGGTAGLALGCALADALGTARIAILDPASLSLQGAAMEARKEPRAFALSAGAKRMLTVLGAWPSLAAHAQPVTRSEERRVGKACRCRWAP